jgi:hypothetical protein
VNDRDAKHAAIERQIAAFLANGGKIRHCAVGESALDPKPKTIAHRGKSITILGRDKLRKLMTQDRALTIERRGA